LWCFRFQTNIGSTVSIDLESEKRQFVYLHNMV